MDRPSRRRNITVTFRVGNMKFDLSFGILPKTKKVFEVFFSGMTEGSAMQGLLTSFCVMVSRALQRGDDPDHMLDGTIGAMPFPPTGFIYEMSGEDSNKLGEVPSVTYAIIRAIDWINSGCPPKFVWSP